MPPTRVRPIASVLVYNEGQGDPYVTDHGLGWLDVLAQSWAHGTFERRSDGSSLLEFLPEIGLTCRPFLVPKDTRLSHFSMSSGGGSWEERRPATGAYRVYRLQQYDSSPGVLYSATTTYALPEDPHFAFSLILPDTPADWDSTALPPYVRVEFGGTGTGSEERFAVQVDKNGAYLLRSIDGVWQIAAELGGPGRGTGYADLDEMFFLVRCLRGRVGVSTDFGRTYAWAGNADTSYVTVPSGKLTLRGQGGMVYFGLHQLFYQAGAWTSPTRNTFTSRPGAVPSITGRYDAPAGTSIVWTDRSRPADGIAQYRVRLSPKTITALPFPFYAPPVLYSTTFRYPVTPAGGSGAYTTPWDTRLVHLEVDKPFELAQGSCTFTVKLDLASTFSGNYRDRKIQVKLGWKMSDGSEQWWTVFTGYIEGVTPQWDGYGQGYLTVRAANASSIFRTTEWTPLDVLALPAVGSTINAAADYILSTEGLSAAYRSWHALGNSWVLDPGSPENPAELLRPGERKWETLERLFGYAGLEIIATDFGLFSSGPRNHVSATAHPYRASDYAGLSQLVERISNPVDYGQSVTAALVTGRDAAGRPALAWAVDAAAESSTSSGRFAPRRRVVQEALPGTVTPGLLVGRVQSLAYEHFPLKYEPELIAYLNLDVNRRDQVWLYGAAEIGVAEGAAHVVLSLRHTFHVDEERGDVELTTAAGLRRL
jgi:hypothetical protein